MRPTEAKVVCFILLYTFIPDVAVFSSRVGILSPLVQLQDVLGKLTHLSHCISFNFNKYLAHEHVSPSSSMLHVAVLENPHVDSEDLALRE